MMKTYKDTMYSCFIGYAVQAFVTNFVPLLFVTFQNEYALKLSNITLLITMSFITQLLADLFSAKMVHKLGYRWTIIIAHICAAAGLILLTVLPAIFLSPFLGIGISVVVYSFGNGLIEVLLSPIIEGCPIENKDQAMSLLHSFYCWGHVTVVLVSTVFFALFSVEKWKILALIWAVFPIANIFYFSKVPLFPLIQEDEEELKIKELFHNKIFWLLIVMMLSAGACEMTISQWASTFAEEGLGVIKSIGDLAGSMSFALFMGTSRFIYGKYGQKIDLNKFMYISGGLCLAAYLTIGLVPNAVIGLICCGICGFSVGILWPGTISKASVLIKRGGILMFSFLGLAGDLGCSAGPTVAGLISSSNQDNLHLGILAVSVFPMLVLLGIYITNRSRSRK